MGIAEAVFGPLAGLPESGRLRVQRPGTRRIRGGRPSRGCCRPAAADAIRASGLGWASIARMWLADLDGSAATAQQARSASAAAGDHMTAA